MSSQSAGGNTTAKDQIEQFLNQNSGQRYTVGEIADAIGYSRNHVRGEAKALAKNGVINGQKNQSRRVPAYIINGDYRVLVSRQQLLDVIKSHKPNHFSRLKNASLDTLRKFVRNNIATSTAAGDAMWEFWV